MKRTSIINRIFLPAFLGTIILLTASAASAQSVVPHFDCVEPVLENGVPNGAFKAYFGYTNTTANTVTINEGSNNFFNPNPNGQYSGQQTTVFLPGFHKRSFSVVYNDPAAANSPTRLTWIVQNQPAITSAEWGNFCGSGMITYQGRLTVAGAAANQPHDFQIQFYDALTGGAPNGEVFELQDVPVVNGIFTIQLDADYIFRNYSGGAQFIEIRVRPGNSVNSYAALAPRQQLTAAPFAINAKNVSGGKVQIPFTAFNATCNKPGDYGQIRYKTISSTYYIEVCTPNGWKTAVLQ